MKFPYIVRCSSTTHCVLQPKDAEWLKAKREEDEEDIEQGLRIPNFMPNNFCLFGFILQCLVLSIQGKLTDVDS